MQAQTNAQAEGRGWTDERVATLKRLWGEGYSASQISRHFRGVFSRNAVIGKASRLGLPSRPKDGNRTYPTKPARPKAPAVAKAQAAPPKPEAGARPPRPYDESPALPAAPETATATVLSLGAHGCKWPIGEPGKDGFGLCGRVRHDRRPYCAEHERVAHPVTRNAKAPYTARELERSIRRYL